MIGEGLIQKVGEVGHLFFFSWFSLPYAKVLFSGRTHIQVLRHRPSRYIRSVPYNLRDSILSPSPFPFPLRVQINNPGLVQRIVITQKKKKL